MGEEGGINLYGFVGNDPVNGVDSWGLQQFGAPGLPPVPVPGGGPDNGWKWNPDPNNSRGGSFGPKIPIPGQSQPSGSFDPEGHWDIDDGLGNRDRYTPNGEPLTPEEAHGGKGGKDDKKSNTAKNIAIGIGGVGIGYLIYRGLRMLPSLIPPLWPTIVPNALCP